MTAIEIYNPTDTAININNWKIEVNNIFYSNSVTISANFDIQPGSYFVIFENMGVQPSLYYNTTGISYIVVSIPDFSNIANRFTGYVALINPTNTAGDILVQGSMDVATFPAGVTWNPNGGTFLIQRDLGESIIRKVKIPVDTNSALDWQISYVTIGSSNDSSQ